MIFSLDGEKQAKQFNFLITSIFAEHPVARTAPISLHCEHVPTLRWVRLCQVASLRSSPAKHNKTQLGGALHVFPRFSQGG